MHLLLVNHFKSKAMTKEITLRTTFLNKTFAKSPNGKFSKIVRVTNGNSYNFTGATKKECEQKARAAYRWNGYSKSWFESDVESD